jgi:hypothetical protein
MERRLRSVEPLPAAEAAKILALPVAGHGVEAKGAEVEAEAEGE